MGHLSTITDPHRDWLAERNRFMAEANSDDPTMTDADTDILSGQMIAIERRLQETPARTVDGMAAKLLMLIQLTAEGNEIGEEVAAIVVREAQGVLDMGSLVSVSHDVRTAIGEGRLTGSTALRHATWNAARRAFELARAAELASADDEEGNRLTGLRDTAEDVLMAIPSPDATAFAFKYLVAFGGGRETDGWNAMLEAEARRFTGGEA